MVTSCKWRCPCCPATLTKVLGPWDRPPSGSVRPLRWKLNLGANRGPIGAD